MKVCLVQAPHWNIHTPSYAIALLTGALRSRGFTVFPKDYDSFLYHAVSAEERKLWLNENAAFWIDDRRLREFIRQHDAFIDWMAGDILNHDPDVVGFSVKSWSQVFAEVLAARVKCHLPNSVIVFGGPQMSAQPPADYLAGHPAVDAIGLREADVSFPVFLETLERNGRPSPVPGFVVRAPDGTIADGGPAPPPAVEEIKFADYTDFDFSRYLNPRSITMLMSRGCINRCSFCTESPAFARYRAYPAERTFAELVHHARQVRGEGPLRIFFNDSLLNGSTREFERLADLLVAARKPGRAVPGANPAGTATGTTGMAVEYGGMLFLRNDLTDGLIAKLADSGLNEVLFGLESGSPAVLERMRKPVDLATAGRVFRAFHDRGVRVSVSVIFGHPGETETEFHRSLDFLRANAANVDNFLLNFLGLYVGCDIVASPQKYGIDPATAIGTDWVGDEGRNTFAVRNSRVNLARLALGRKVSDCGWFSEENGFYNPVAPYQEEIAGLRTKLAGLQAELDWQRHSRLDLVWIATTAPPPKGIQIGNLERVERVGEQWVAHGWARDPFQESPAVEVVIMNETSRVVALCRPEHKRPDVEAEFAALALRHTGFEAGISLARLHPGQNILRAFVYDAATGVAWALAGEVSVDNPAPGFPET